jgi:hypothetical protein
VNQRHHLETYTFPISSRKNTNWVFSFHYIGYQTLLFSFRSNINLYFPFNLSLYIVSTSILVMYYILTWPKIGGWKMSIYNHFQKCSMKVTFRNRHLKKPFIYSDYLLKNICQEDPNSHFSLI